MTETPAPTAEKGASVAATGRVEPISCTYNGYGDPASPWVFRDDMDRYGPVLECDVHGLPAQWPVYESSDTGPWSGACQFYEATEIRVLPPEACHCGKPVACGYDGDPTHHRGMCEDCDAVRCDAYPACRPIPPVEGAR